MKVAVITRATMDRCPFRSEKVEIKPSALKRGERHRKQQGKSSLKRHRVAGADSSKDSIDCCNRSHEPSKLLADVSLPEMHFTGPSFMTVMLVYMPDTFDTRTITCIRS